MRGCYGKLNVLTSQTFFDNMFDKNVHIFAGQPNILNNIKNKETTTQYLYLCKLENVSSILHDD